MLTSLSSVLAKAQRGRYAVGAFNFNNLETLQAIMGAAEAEHSPVILQTSEGALAYAGMEELAALVHLAAKKSKRPVIFHLDHGKDYALVVEAVKSGLYTSVMFDGSALPFKENVRRTKKIVEMAHQRGMSVEAEIGLIAGKEDFVSVSERDAAMTQPAQAAEFARLTQCDALAVAIGTRHGAFKMKKESSLDFHRLKLIAEATRVPLVLHGASGVPSHIKRLCTQSGCEISSAKGIPDAQIKKAVSLGICKVNIDTDLRIAFDAGIRTFLKQRPDVIDPREILKPARDLMAMVARSKMRLFGCSKKG
ncbi:class II fructose-bisphosphate aldolase family protein [Candidatus Parcubacteria bacterium]|nr:class II fructose-bisphosphate aldolase family protein [Candidatus Parcubacteria bacterium]